MPTATADTRRGTRRATWLAVAALVLTAAVIFALTVDRSHPTAAPPTTSGEHMPTAVISDTRHAFKELDALTTASDLVVRGPVVASEVGRVFGSGSAAIRSHVLTLRVDRVLAGSRPARRGAVVLVEEETELTDGTPVSVDGMRASRVGDDGVWFLVASRDPDFPGYAVVNSQGRYLRGTGDALHGGDASDALVGELTQLGARGLEDAVVGTRPNGTQPKGDG